MHKLLGATRRTAGVAAGLILTGGMVGGVLLTSGAAYAASAAATTTTVSGTAQDNSIDVTVSVAPSGATGSVSVTGAGRGCTAYVDTSGSGSCDIGFVRPGTYTLTATYQPSQDAAANFLSSTGTSQPVTVTGPAGNPNPNPNPTPGGDAPAFSSDSPPTSVDGQSYSYQFQASGSPSFQLLDAPSWLSIGSDGTVSGDIPDGTDSFSYWVDAWNNWGHHKIGPFTVYCHHQNNHHNNYAYVNLHTSLYCTSPVRTGQRGTCTLWVTNSYQRYFPWGEDNDNYGQGDSYSQYGQNYTFGQDYASDVTAEIDLPWQLRADFCGYSYPWTWSGCSIDGNTVTEDLGNLRPGQTRSLTVTFTARSGFNLWGHHPGHSFWVKVVGSASSDHGYFFFTGHGDSYSVAYVHIIPRGFWW